MACDTLRVSDEFPELFHYTTVSAFENIYASQTFWATHYEDLNDSSELLRFRLQLCKFAAPIIREIFHKRMQCDTRLANEIGRRGGIDAVVKEEAAQQVDTIHGETFGERWFRDTFICSFCNHGAQPYQSENGLLSQWRAYGAGGGVAIVLDTAGIEGRMKYEADVFAHPINHIGDVKYDDDDVGIRKVFCNVFDRLPGILDAFYSRQQPAYDEILGHFVQGSTLVKHHAFREENEIRIVVSPRATKPGSISYDDVDGTKREKVIRYRRRGDTEVRYIQLFGDGPLPIKRVIVGPSRVQNLNYQAIASMVKGSEIEIIRSETPFIG